MRIGFWEREAEQQENGEGEGQTGEGEGQTREGEGQAEGVWEGQADGEGEIVVYRHGRQQRV